MKLVIKWLIAVSIGVAAILVGKYTIEYLKGK